MSKKEEQSEQYRRKVFNDSPTIKRCKHNNEVIAWNNEIIGAFEAGWDAAINKACEFLRREYEDIGIRYIRGGNVEEEIEELRKFVEE